jgi:hypothetical protein
MKCAAFLLTCIVCVIVSCNNHPPEHAVRRCKLLELPTDTINCGKQKNLIGYKFKDVTTDEPVILLIPCPELLGSKFFVKNKLYEAETSLTNEKFPGYKVINSMKDPLADVYYANRIKEVY